MDCTSQKLIKIYVDEDGLLKSYCLIYDIQFKTRWLAARELHLRHIVGIFSIFPALKEPITVSMVSSTYETTRACLDFAPLTSDIGCILSNIDGSKVRNGETEPEDNKMVSHRC